MTGIDVDRGEPAPTDPPDPSARAAAGTGDSTATDTTGPSDSDTTEYRLDASADAPATAGRRRRRNKVSKWDRPPPPHDWRWWVGNLGKTLIAVGILMFGFVAYQLWGTGIENAASQRALENDFEELLAEFEPIEPSAAVDTTSAAGSEANGDVDAPSADSETETDAAASPSDEESGATDDDSVVPLEQEQPVIDPVEVVPVVDQNLPPVEDGDAIARIEIPRIGVNDIVVAGVAVGDLKRGPGHFPDTPLPGQLGNSAIAGHRTTYGAPFFNVDKLETDDEIIVTTLNGRFVYRVTGDEIVPPSAYGVVATTDPTKSTLTLVSCHPRYTARQRIIISAELDVAASGPVGEPVLNYGRPPELPDPDTTAEVADEPEASPSPDDEAAIEPAEATDETSTDAPTAAATDDADDAGSSTTGSLTAEPATADDLLAVDPTATSADVFSKGWFSDPAANSHVGLWGLALAAIAVLAYLISRKVRRDWVGLMVGIVPFVVVLYFFFQNVNRLLPPNL